MATKLKGFHLHPSPSSSTLTALAPFDAGATYRNHASFLVQILISDCKQHRVRRGDSTSTTFFLMFSTPQKILNDSLRAA